MSEIIEAERISPFCGEGYVFQGPSRIIHTTKVHAKPSVAENGAHFGGKGEERMCSFQVLMKNRLVQITLPEIKDRIDFSEFCCLYVEPHRCDAILLPTIDPISIFNSQLIHSFCILCLYPFLVERLFSLHCFLGSGVFR